MTGERLDVVIAGVADDVLEREREQPQPGGREPAPGELVLLQSFLNTHFDLLGEWGADLLAGPEQLLAWFSGRGLSPAGTRRPSSARVRDVTAVREGLRELTRRNREPGHILDETSLARTNGLLARISLGLELGPQQVVLAPCAEDPIEAGLAVLLAIAVRAMIDGRWGRLKACPGEHCGWVFYDHSRNNSSRWCSMEVCGGRAKARSHYRRRRLRGGDGA